MRTKHFFLLLPFLSFFIWSCGADAEEIRAKEDMDIMEYLAANNLTAEKTASGLYYIIEEEGNGEALEYPATVDYVGYLLNGDIFDSGVFQLTSLNSVIPGWQEGIPLFSLGGKGKLLIPSRLGYGESGSGPIEANTVLIFDIEIIDEKLIKEEEDTEIQEYLLSNNLTAQSTASGLYYIIENEGDGEFPMQSSLVTVEYSGYFLNGNIFDGGVLENFSLSRVIPGWQQGIPLFSRGGIGKLIIPSHLAYGSSGAGTIPSYSILVFDIELIDFTN